MKVQKRLGRTVAAGAEHPLARRKTEGSQAEPVSAGVPDSVPAAPPGAPACPPRLRSHLLPPPPTPERYFQRGRHPGCAGPSPTPAPDPGRDSGSLGGMNEG